MKKQNDEKIFNLTSYKYSSCFIDGVDSKVILKDLFEYLNSDQPSPLYPTWTSIKIKSFVVFIDIKKNFE